ncbi:MAG: hypothetical protein WCL59_08845 [Cyanobium sp. ELA507]
MPVQPVAASLQRPLVTLGMAEQRRRHGAPVVRQRPLPWPKADLRFPYGEAQPSCWLHPPQRESAGVPGAGVALPA